MRSGMLVTNMQPIPLVDGYYWRISPEGREVVQMINGLINGQPPEGGIDVWFSEVEEPDMNEYYGLIGNREKYSPLKASYEVEVRKWKRKKALCNQRIPKMELPNDPRGIRRGI